MLPVVVDRGEAFSSASGRAMQARRKEQAGVLREARRGAVEEHLGTRMGAAVELFLSAVDAAEREQVRADGVCEVPDKDVMARGLRAAEQILDRLVGKAAGKIEGEITHQHVFNAVAEAIKDRRG